MLLPLQGNLDNPILRTLCKTVTERQDVQWAHEVHESPPLQNKLTVAQERYDPTVPVANCRHDAT